MMDVSNLARLVQKAVEGDPPPALLSWCGTEDHYRPYYHLLYLLALHTEHACVELGVEKGRGCFAMCLAGREVHGFESTPRDAEMAVMRARFPGFHFHHAPSLPAPESFARVGLLHVDTEHSYAMAREEYKSWRRHLAPGAVVCFDDLHAQNDDVGRFVVSLGLPAVMDDRLHECGYGAVIHDG